jgi:hypothetical protein
LKVQVESLLKVSENATHTIGALPSLENPQDSAAIGEKDDKTTGMHVNSANSDALADLNYGLVENVVSLDNVTVAYLVDDNESGDTEYDHPTEIVDSPRPSQIPLNQIVVNIFETEDLQLSQYKLRDTTDADYAAMDSTHDHTRTLVLKANVMVHNLTKRVLSQASPAAEWSWEHANLAPGRNTNTKAKSSKADRKSKSPNIQQRDKRGPRFDAEPVVRPNSAEKKEEAAFHADGMHRGRNGQAQQDTQRNVHEYLDESKSDSDLDNESIVEAQSQLPDATVDLLSERIVGMIQHSMVDKLAELQIAKTVAEKAQIVAESEAKLLRPSEDRLQPPIRFKDAVGRKFSFPWHLCKTWKVPKLRQPIPCSTDYYQGDGSADSAGVPPRRRYRSARTRRPL